MVKNQFTENVTHAIVLLFSNGLLGGLKLVFSSFDQRLHKFCNIFWQVSVKSDATGPSVFNELPTEWLLNIPISVNEYSHIYVFMMLLRFGDFFFCHIEYILRLIKLQTVFGLCCACVRYYVFPITQKLIKTKSRIWWNQHDLHTDVEFYELR